MSKAKVCTFCIPVIRPDLVETCLKTLYKYTEVGTFNVIVVDQTFSGLDPNLRNRYQDLTILRSPITEKFRTGNIGFQFANNLALKLTDTPYFGFLNDDVEFINSKWWQGVLDTFAKVEKATPTRPALLVNVGSIKLPDWSIGLDKGEIFEIIPYKPEFTNEDWDFLISEPHYVNEHLTIQPGSVIDGINLYCSIAKTDVLRKIGIDDLWYPGSAGDYDLANVASMWGYRCIGTTLSWVYHHWSVTFESINNEQELGELVIPEIHHTDLREKWWTNFEMWGTNCPECKEILHTEDGVTAICPKHKDQIYKIPQNIIETL